MRVLFLSTWFPFPPDNGSKLRVYHLLQSLVNCHEVTLVSFAFDTAMPEEASDILDLCVDVRTIPVDPFLANSTSMLRTFLSMRPVASRTVTPMSRLVDKMFNTLAFDAVVASTGMMIDYLLEAPPHVAKILEEHNSMTRWMNERYQNASGPLQRIRYWVSWQKQRHYEQRQFRHIDLLTMVSSSDATTTKSLVESRRTRVEVVPNGVDCAYNRPGLSQTEPAMLVYNGALTYNANYDAMRWFLAEVLPRIQAGVPDVTLTITGSTTGVDLSGLTLNPNVRLIGFVEDVRVPVARATVCVVPVRLGGGTRLKILEAMALGTPVVATTKGAEGLEVVDGEHLLLADSPEEFSCQTRLLLRNSGMRRRLANNARRLVEQRYDWEQIGRRFVDLVEDAVSSKSQIAS